MLRMQSLFYGWISVSLLLDLLTKWWMENHLSLGDTRQVIEGWLSWKLIHNPGASFGMFSGHLVALISFQLLVIVLIFIVYAKSRKSWSVNFGYVMLIGGAIGNLVSRLSFGYVSDFISFRLWPAVFNLADVEIRIGALLLVILYLKSTRKVNQNRHNGEDYKENMRCDENEI